MSLCHFYMSCLFGYLFKVFIFVNVKNGTVMSIMETYKGESIWEAEFSGVSKTHYASNP